MPRGYECLWYVWKGKTLYTNRHWRRAPKIEKITYGSHPFTTTITHNKEPKQLFLVIVLVPTTIQSQVSATLVNLAASSFPRGGRASSAGEGLPFVHQDSRSSQINNIKEMNTVMHSQL